MARLPRLFLPGCPQHIIQRGNNRQATFFTDEDYKVYIDKLSLYADKHKVQIHAYVLMTNHVHLLLTAVDEWSISKLMQSLGRYYVLYINKTYQRTGTLWDGRYKSTLVDSDTYLLTVMRYIELNSVRAAMVEHPVEYPWSSYQANAVGKSIVLISPHEVYQQLGKTQAERLSSYVSLFDNNIEENTLETIRNSTDKAWVLGTVRFKEQVEEQTKRRVAAIPRGGGTRRRHEEEIGNPRHTVNELKINDTDPIDSRH
ncbi:transposase [Amphritea japonica]|uniref:Transposase, IS200 family n=1 Tax=Amphritea japonica ATCC BAA-1530 TaxID=1278309 RepID=A0A7R6PN29_9GAMM|nr:transposase [Amphritea japonica]BBB26398.1 transposase, IS200 family [Amphritea japonica ATCC BAA-1530]